GRAATSPRPHDGTRRRPRVRPDGAVDECGRGGSAASRDRCHWRPRDVDGSDLARAADAVSVVRTRASGGGAVMYEVKSIIRPERLSAVVQALHEIPDLPGLTVSVVRGFGRRTSAPSDGTPQYGETEMA